MNYSPLRPILLTLTLNRAFPPPTTLRSRFKTMATMSSLDLQGSQDTLKVLQSIGLDLSWDPTNNIAHPTGSGGIPSEQLGVLGYLNRLASVAQTVSGRHLLSSLLAGPDNEADDSLDIPLVLGQSQNSEVGKRDTVDWVLGRLGLSQLDHSHLIIREAFEDQQASPSSVADQQPWILSRLSESQSVQTNTPDPERIELDHLLATLRPRLSLEIAVPQSPHRPVCLLVGLIPQSSDLWGGLISYRVST